MRPIELFILFWLLFTLSWLLAAFWRAPVTSRLSSGVVWAYRLLFVLGFVLLNHRASAALHAPRLFHLGRGGADLLALLMLPGFAFAWWGRLRLGRLWSAEITRTAAHRVVTEGPYAIVRHPIYTGILFACLMTGLVQATWVAFAGVLAIAAGMWLKARAEEAFLAVELGHDAYQAYRRRVPMLVPFWPLRN